MNRGLVIHLIEKKQAIRQDLHNLTLEYALLTQKNSSLVIEDLADEFLKLSAEELATQDKLFQLKLSILDKQTRLERAHYFGRRYSHSLVPTLCVMCFVDHYQQISLMAQLPDDTDSWPGRKHFECPVCKYILRVDQTQRPAFKPAIGRIFFTR